MKPYLLIIHVLIIGLLSCQKTIDTHDDIYNQTDTETLDFDDDNVESEPPILEERSVSFKIYSVKPLNESDTVNTEGCGKFQGYAKLDLFGGAPFKIRGIGFGSIQGTSTVTATYKTTSNFPLIINAWSDTAITVTVAKFEHLALPVLKNLSLKFTINRDFITNLGISKKKVSKIVKGTSWYKNYGTMSNLGDTIEAYYPSSLWQVAYLQRERQTLLQYHYSQRIKIDTFYHPKIGDVLTRSPITQQFAIVTDILTTDSKGYQNIRVWERNYKCNGAIQKKAYKYKNGVFQPKYNELPFTHYCYETDL